MALAIYCKSDFPWAEDYFRMMPIEPLGGGLSSMPIKQGFGVDQILLEDVISIIDPLEWTNWASSFMLASHGTTEAIKMGLCFDRPEPLKAKDLEALFTLTKPETDVAKLAKRFKIDDYVLAGIQSKLNEFRKLSISTLAIRACRIGNNDAFLLRLAELLNIKHISAPLYRDFFGVDRDPLVAKAGTYDAGLKKFPTLKPFGEKPNRVLMAFEVKPHHQFNIHTMAESEQAVVDFYREQFTFANPPAVWHESMGINIFGIQKRPGVVVFPGNPAYTSMFRVVTNPKYFMTDMRLPPLPMPPFGEPAKPARPHRVRRFFAKVFAR